jgi:hypothetical protein
VFFLSLLRVAERAPSASGTAHEWNREPDSLSCYRFGDLNPMALCLYPIDREIIPKAASRSNTANKNLITSPEVNVVALLGVYSRPTGRASECVQKLQSPMCCSWQSLQQDSSSGYVETEYSSLKCPGCLGQAIERPYSICRAILLKPWNMCFDTNLFTDYLKNSSQAADMGEAWSLGRSSGGRPTLSVWGAPLWERMSFPSNRPPARGEGLLSC